MDINKEIKKELNVTKYESVETKEEQFDTWESKTVKEEPIGLEKERIDEKAETFEKLDTSKKVKYLDTNSIYEKNTEDIATRLIEKRVKEHKKQFDVYKENSVNATKNSHYNPELNKYQIKVIHDIALEFERDTEEASDSFLEVKNAIKEFDDLNLFVNNKEMRADIAHEVRPFVAKKDFRSQYKNAYKRLKRAIQEYLQSHSGARFSIKGRRRVSLCVKCAQEQRKMLPFAKPFLAGLKELDNLKDCIREGSIVEESKEEFNNFRSYFEQNKGNIKKLHDDLKNPNPKIMVMAILAVYKLSSDSTNCGKEYNEKYSYEALLDPCLERATKYIESLPLDVQSKYMKEIIMIEHGMNHLLAKKYREASMVKGENDDNLEKTLKNDYAKAVVSISDLTSYNTMFKFANATFAMGETNWGQLGHEYIFAPRNYEDGKEENGIIENIYPKMVGISDWVQLRVNDSYIKEHLSKEEYDKYLEQSKKEREENLSGRHYFPKDMIAFRNLVTQLEEDSESQTDSFKSVVKNVTEFLYGADHRELETKKNHSKEYMSLFNAALRSLTQYNNKHKGFRLTKKGDRRQKLVMDLYDKMLELDIQNFEEVKTIGMVNNLDEIDEFSIEEKSLEYKRGLSIRDKMAPIVGGGLLPVTKTDINKFDSKDAYNYNFNNIISSIPMLEGDIDEKTKRCIQLIPMYIVNMKFDDKITQKNYGIANPQFYPCMKSLLLKASTYMAHFEFPNDEFKKIYEQKKLMLEKYLTIVEKNLEGIGIKPTSGEILERPLDEATLNYDRGQIETLKGEIDVCKEEVLKTEASKYGYNNFNKYMYMSFEELNKMNKYIKGPMMDYIKVVSSNKNDLFNIYLYNNYFDAEFIKNELNSKGIEYSKFANVALKEKAKRLIDKYNMKSFERSIGYFLEGYKVNVLGEPADQESEDIMKKNDDIMDAYLNDDHEKIEKFFNSVIEKCINSEVDLNLPENIESKEDALRYAKFVVDSRPYLIINDFLKIPENKELYSKLSEEKREYIKKKSMLLMTIMTTKVEVTLIRHGLKNNESLVCAQSDSEEMNKNYKKSVEMGAPILEANIREYEIAKNRYLESLK